MVDTVLTDPASNTNGETGQDEVAKAAAEEAAKAAGEEGKDPAKVEDGKADKTKTDGAPEKYEDFKLPDGFTADKEVAEEFKAAAKELNIPQEKAQKLVDLQAKLMTRSAEANAKRITDLQKTWRDAATNDSEYGGKDFEANLGKAKQALDKFGSDKFKEMLEVTGLGNNPELIRLLVNVGKTITEDQVMTGGGNGTETKDPAKILFPSMA